MTRELYQVEEDDNGKYIHYNGFLWQRDNAMGECDEKTGEPLDYALTEGSGCYAYLRDIEKAFWIEDEAHRISDFIDEKFSEVVQYQTDMGETEYNESMSSWAQCPYLDIDEVTQDTPCGMYYYDVED